MRNYNSKQYGDEAMDTDHEETAERLTRELGYLVQPLPEGQFKIHKNLAMAITGDLEDIERAARIWRKIDTNNNSEMENTQ